MFKRFVMIGFLGISLAAILGTEAKAHYVPTLSGWGWHSVQCNVDLKGVPNPSTKPAVVECVVSTALVEILCQNPAGHDVQPGQPAIQMTLIAQHQIEDKNITDKKKGKAHVEVLVPDDSLLKSEFCVNPNWIPIDVLIREMTAQINTYECVGPAGAPCSVLRRASIVQAECALPAEFNFGNLPPVGTPYECTDKVTVHEN